MVRGWTDKSENVKAAMADERIPSLTPYAPSVRTYMSMMYARQGKRLATQARSISDRVKRRHEGFGGSGLACTSDFDTMQTLGERVSPAALGRCLFVDRSESGNGNLLEEEHFDSSSDNPLVVLGFESLSPVAHVERGASCEVMNNAPERKILIPDRAGRPRAALRCKVQIVVTVAIRRRMRRGRREGGRGAGR